MKLINPCKNLISLKSIITDLKKFFSTYLNTNFTELKNETLIIEDLNMVNKNFKIILSKVLSEYFIKIFRHYLMLVISYSVEKSYYLYISLFYF